jgi:protein-S-isoprenylcysteine O-methyltransferase Ste14
MLKRLSFFVYGSVSYLIFLATFLYTIGFVGGFAVPTQLDAPAEGAVGGSLGIDLLLLTVFAVQHSVMARRGFKRWWMRIVPSQIERSTYVLCASVALILLVALWQPLGGIVWQVQRPVAVAAIYTVFALGWGLVLLATFLINHFDLFGLRQVWFALQDRPYVPVSLATPWLYRVVRHPLYLGFLMAFWAAPTMTVAHLVFAGVTTVYILVAIQLEERDLVAEHGVEYEDYSRRVPMLIPGTR